MLRLLFIACLGFAACTAQTGSEYQGEPIAALHGTIAIRDDYRSEGAEIVVLYFGMGKEERVPSLPKTSGVSIPITNTDPTHFRLDIYEPPPRGAYGDVNGTTGDYSRRLTAYPPDTVAVGTIVAVKGDADKNNIKREDILGVSLDHTLLYFGDGEDTFDFKGRVARQYKVEATKGYHLSRVYPLSLPERAAERLAFHECYWADGLCVHRVTLGDVDPEAYSELDEWNYNECIKRIPTPRTCTVWSGSNVSEEQSRLTVDCLIRAEISIYEPHESCSPDLATENENGLDDPITVNFGASLLDALLQVN